MKQYILTVSLASIILLTGCNSTKDRLASNTMTAEEIELERALESGEKVEIICRHNAKTGSHLKKRNCMTRAQLEATRAASREMYMQSQHSQSPRTDDR